MPDAWAGLRSHCEVRLDEGLATYGVPLDLPVRAQLLDFLGVLLRWNRVHNLTAVRHPVDMVDRHLLDSLSVLAWLPVTGKPAEAHRYDVIDVGSGAGLPCLPLAMARPDLSFLSVEANGKKARFQKQAVIATGLSNVVIEADRIECLPDRAACVISRAFTAPAAFLAEATKHSLPGSAAILMLGQAARLPEPMPPGWRLQALRAAVPGRDDSPRIALCQRLEGAA